MIMWALAAAKRAVAAKIVDLKIMIACVDEVVWELILSKNVVESVKDSVKECDV